MQEKQKLVLAITDLAMKLSIETKADVLAWFSSHVMVFDVVVYLGGWKSSKNNDFQDVIYLNQDGAITKLKNLESYLVGLLEESRKAS